MLLNSIRKLLAPNNATTADDIARGLDALDGRLAEGRKTLEAAIGRRGIALLAGDAEVAKNRAEVAAARDEVEDLTAARPLVVEQLAAARQAEAAIAAQAVYDAAKAASDAAAKALRVEYEPALRKLRSLARRVEEARALVHEANANLPAGAGYLPDPEAVVRGRATSPAQVTERRVSRWFACGTDDRNPLPKQREGELSITGRTAILTFIQSNPATGGTIGVPHFYELRDVIEITTTPAIEPGEYDWMRTMRLPGLRLGDGAFEAARWDADPASVIAALDAAERQKAPATERPEATTTYKAVPVDPGPRQFGDALVIA